MSRAIYLFSISHNMNVGPFHKASAEYLTIEEENEIWRRVYSKGADHIDIALP